MHGDEKKLCCFYVGLSKSPPSPPPTLANKWATIGRDDDDGDGNYVSRSGK